MNMTLFASDILSFWAQLSAATAPALDRARLVLSQAETAFLHDSISQDDEEMHERIFAVQDRYVIILLSVTASSLFLRRA